MIKVPGFFSRLPIRGKLLMLTLLTSSVAILFSATLFTIYQLTVFRGQLVREASTLADVLVDETRLAMKYDDHVAIERSLHSLHDDESIVSASVYGQDGKPIASFIRTGDDETIPESAGESAEGFLDHYLVLFKPVVDKGQTIGTVYLKTETFGIYERIMREGLIGAIIMFGSFVVAFLLSTRFQRQISTPIQDLARTVRLVTNDSGGAASTDVQSEDELDVLVAAFNDMLGGIRHRDAELKRSEHYYRSLIENTSDVITIVDADGVIRYSSPSAEVVLGVAPESLLGRSLTSLVADEAHDAVAETLARVQRQPGNGVRMEVRVRHADGGWRTLEVICNNQLEDEAINGIIIHCHDITQREQAAGALKESETRFRNLVEHAADPFFLHDLDGQIIDVNQRTSDSLGYTRDELMQMNVADLEFCGDQEGVSAAWTGMQPGESRSLDAVHCRKDGSQFPVEVRVGLFEYAGRQFVVALARDMTEREQNATDLREARDLAEAAHRTKAGLLANMSHEIRTPMTAVVGMTDLLEGTGLTGTQVRYLDVIRDSSETLLSVIDDVLDLSAIESGKLALSSLDFDLRNIVEGAVAMFAQRAQGKRIELASLVDGDVPSALRGDPGRLRQVLVNLLGNAVKFTEHGQVDIHVTRVKETDAELWVKFAVRDSGIGVPAELQTQLFQPFVALDDGAEDQPRSTGLGLTICKSLSSMMGGEVGIDTNPDGGSIFWMTACLEKRADTRATAAQILGDRHTYRVLVVDDNPTVRGYLAAKISSWGLRISECPQGPEALELLESQARAGDPFDLALIDYEMPGMSGLSVVRAARSNSKLMNTRLVMMTPLGEGAVDLQRLDLDVDAQLIKPVREKQLQRILRELGENPAAIGLDGGIPDTDGGPEPFDPANSVVDSEYRVLLAAENPTNREVISLMLRQLGCRVTAVADTEAALKAYSSDPFDVAIIDCDMRGMKNYGLAAEMREAANDGSHSAIVALTAYSSAGDKERRIQSGIDDYIIKPLTSDRLAVGLEKWCEKVAPTSH
ncbi:MAG: hypothetical protein DRQ37_00295 [Gammaproteobacteria bacterium]|nr:MAG: hypothetical protein DRQ37_00295 [Gammaproteobacteria bacterium]